MKTIEISGKKYLECENEACEWNVPCTPDGPSIPGIEVIIREDKLPRVCNFGIAAYRILGLPKKCRYKDQVRSILDRITYCRVDNEAYPVRRK